MNFNHHLSMRRPGGGEAEGLGMAGEVGAVWLQFLFNFYLEFKLSACHNQVKSMICFGILLLPITKHHAVSQPCTVRGL